MARGRNARLQPTSSRPKGSGSSPPRWSTARRVVPQRHTQEDSSSGEVIALDDVNMNDSVEESVGDAVLPQARSLASIEPAARSCSAPTRPPSLDLLAPPPPKPPGKTPDIDYFFDKSDPTITICRDCKYVTTFPWA